MIILFYFLSLSLFLVLTWVIAENQYFAISKFVAEQCLNCTTQLIPQFNKFLLNFFLFL